MAAMAREFELPEQIIHHIQSFLDGRDAVRTSVLSKSWYTACSTRPVLCFAEKDFTLQAINTFQPQQLFGKRLTDNCIKVFANANLFDCVCKTLQRYVRMNLKVDKFALTMEDHGEYNAAYRFQINQLIERVSELGVNEIDFTSNRYLILPPQLFTPTLTKISVSFSAIDKLMDTTVLCSRLVSLSLRECYVTESSIRAILSTCPKIEYLYLDDCYSLLYKDECRHMVKKLSARDLFSLGGEGRRHVVTSCSNLRALRLDQVMLDDEFFSKFSRRFPCVEDLVLKRFYGPGVEDLIQISSHSIKYLTLYPERQLMLKNLHLDVPNIRKFSFSFHTRKRDGVPSLSVVNTTTMGREWMSQINLHIPIEQNSCRGRERFDLRPNWLFPKLRQILKELSGSTVTLHFRFSYFYISSHDQHQYLPLPVPDDEPLSPPDLARFLPHRQHREQEFPYFLTAVVENVTVHMYPAVDMCPHQFGDLCRFFRPNLITRDLNIRQQPPVISTATDSKYKNMLCSKQMSALFGANGLEEVTLEFFEDTILEWQNIELKELISDGPCKEKLARLRLKWRQTLTGKRKERTHDFLCSDVFKWFSNPWQ